MADGMESSRIEPTPERLAQINRVIGRKAGELELTSKSWRAHRAEIVVGLIRVDNQSAGESTTR